MLHKFSHRFRATYNASRAKNKCFYMSLSNFRTPVSFSYYFCFFRFLLFFFLQVLCLISFEFSLNLNSKNIRYTALTSSAYSYQFKNHCIVELL